jgi:hypothetical protein
VIAKEEALGEKIRSLQEIAGGEENRSDLVIAKDQALGERSGSLREIRACPKLRVSDQYPIVTGSFL